MSVNFNLRRGQRHDFTRNDGSPRVTLGLRFTLVEAGSMLISQSEIPAIEPFLFVSAV